MLARTLAVVPCLVHVAAAAAAEDGGADKLAFNRDVRPILADTCFKCHGFDKAARKAGLRLDVREDAVAPRDGKGPAIVPGDPAASLLWRRIVSEDPDERMPPSPAHAALTDSQKATLRAWIEQGAAYQPHWAFVAPVRPPLPVVKQAGWARNEIDAFVLALLEARGMTPSSEADRATLIRRLSLDLTGLPPTPEEVDAFLADVSPGAYESVVDRLLASPHYGERMALDWLDAARYADTHGYHRDGGRDMTAWRGWVIDAFNRNLPFDRFTVEQLAGDLLPGATVEQRIASGFNRNHLINIETGAVPEEYHAAYVIDRVNTTATVWLGLTAGCAQCHDHKFDPLTQAEYFGLFAFFNNVPENGIDGAGGNAVPLMKLASAEQQQNLDALAAAISEAEAKLSAAAGEIDVAQAEWEKAAAAGSPVPPANVVAALAVAADQRSDAQKAELRAHYRAEISPVAQTLGGELARLQKERGDLDAGIPTTMVMQELPQRRETFVLLRGQYDQKGPAVSAGVPAVLPALPPGAPADRLALARWLVDPANPLTARVTVNRLWQSLFGTGLVKTSEDFGTQGEPPTHPELLDWLAVEFREGNWDVKRLLKRIVTSATYRQSSVITPAALAADPECRLLGRFPRRRLPAELIRDGALAASGLLDRRIGGASVMPYQPERLWEELTSREADMNNFTAQSYVQSHGPDLYRRSMYTFWKRTVPPPQLSTFDAPDRETCTVRRPRTNTPMQALVLLNDPTYVEAARKLAERVMRDGGLTDDGRVAFAFRLPLARAPRTEESAVLKALFAEQLAHYRRDTEAARRLFAVGESPADPALDPAELAAWATVASVILNLDETVVKN
jgi:hypothetical protein